MDLDSFRREAHRLADWMADYLAGVERLPVRSQLPPGAVAAQLPDGPPAAPEPFPDLMADLERVILPGLTHWQHPRFLAYFPANSSPPSLLAEMLTAAFGAQCMLWQTSPGRHRARGPRPRLAAPDDRPARGLRRRHPGLRVQRHALRRPHRPRARHRLARQRGRPARPAAARRLLLGGGPQLRREGGADRRPGLRLPAQGPDRRRPGDAPRRAGRGDPRRPRRRRHPRLHRRHPRHHQHRRLRPAAPDRRARPRARAYLHVDAAWAGSALVCPEQRAWAAGLELADSLVLNPHKWLLTNFDCSAHLVRRPDELVRTLAINPAYLQTREGSAVTDYRDWGIPLGRRFRALKLWFVIRAYGVEGLQSLIRRHIALARELAAWIEADPDFELTSGPSLALLTFRYRPQGVDDEATLDALNARLLEAVNDDGRTYLTQTRLRGRYVIRASIGQTTTERRHVEEAWAAVREIARGLGA